MCSGAKGCDQFHGDGVYEPLLSGYGLWPMAYDAPCGGSVRYTRPAVVRCRDWHEVRVDARTHR
eukprot:3975629-Prymnesium_polylepis.1